MKFMGYVEPARPLLDKAESRDDGMIVLEGAAGCAAFIATCRQLRFWGRTAAATPV